MTTWVLLAGAILSEVSATVSLKLSEGFTRPGPSVVVVVGYGLSFVLLARVLERGVPVGVVYGVWSACGVALVALVGVVFLSEVLSWMQVAGLFLVVSGVVAIQSGGGVH